MSESFRRELLGEFILDEEYEVYLKLWRAYRRQTNHMPREQNARALKIYKEIFGNIPTGGEKYQRAKMDSMRELDSEEEAGK